MNIKTVKAVTAKMCQDQSDKNLTKCDLIRLISKNEAAYGIPRWYLYSIAMVESEMTPYVVNNRRKTFHFRSKQEAVDFVEKKIRSGEKNISIGCMQIHICHVGELGAVENIVDPEKNVEFSAKLLSRLYKKHGNWKRAVQKYHSGNIVLGRIYHTKVMKIRDSMSA